MKRVMQKSYVLVAVSLTLGLIAFGGCKQKATTGGGGTVVGNAGSGDTPTFQFVWSEYPSWSVFGVAEDMGLINGKVGEQGTLEKKYGIDIDMRGIDYDGCLTAYSTGTADAVCITNMDILSPSLGRSSVAILPTSTSDGADACIVTSSISSVDDLKGKSSHGFEATVSQYMFERVLEELGKNPADYPFKQLDPQQAANAMQNRQSDVESIVVWNPYVIQTLRKLEGDAKVLFDSTQIPEEIVDMVVVGEDALKKPGGDKFAQAITEAFYAVNAKIDAADTRDETLIAVGQQFAKLPLEDMQEIVKQTKFYNTPEAGMAIFNRADFQTEIMPKVVDFCASHDIVSTKPSIGYTAGGGEQLKFDTSFMAKAAEPAMAK